LGGDLRARIHHQWVDQIAILDPINQRITKGRDDILTAEGQVGIQQSAAFELTHIHVGVGSVRAGSEPART
jgi:hypothetical protein